MKAENEKGRWMMGKKPSVTVQVDQVWVKVGETLTVWLGDFRQEQVELRVLHSGELEIFTNTENPIHFKTFGEWEPHDEQ